VEKELMMEVDHVLLATKSTWAEFLCTQEVRSLYLAMTQALLILQEIATTRNFLATANDAPLALRGPLPWRLSFCYDGFKEDSLYAMVPRGHFDLIELFRSCSLLLSFSL
jgi:hypothetical protein